MVKGFRVEIFVGVVVWEYMVIRKVFIIYCCFGEYGFRIYIFDLFKISKNLDILVVFFDF